MVWTMTEKTGSRSGFILVVISHALNHMYDALIPILYPPIMSEFSLTYSMVGMLAMGYRMSSAALQLLMGFLGRFVRRKILLSFGMIWQCSSNSFTAFAQTFQHVLISRSLAGIGSSPQHPTGSSFIAENFPRERVGRALGINIAGGMAGGFIAPFLGTFILQLMGWRTSVLMFSIPGLLVGVAFLFVREQKRSQAWSGASSLSVMIEGLHEVFRNRIVLGVMLLETVMAFRMGARDFLPSYFINNLQLTPVESGMVFTLFVAAGVPAPYFWGYLSDKMERRKIVILVMAASALLWYTLSFATNIPQLLLVLLPIGFVGQGVGGVIQGFVAEATTGENRDLIYGIYFTLAFTLGSFSPFIMGFISDSYGFQATFTWVAFVSILSVVLAVLLLRQKHD